MYSAQGMKQIPTASMAFSNRSRSSSKCEISVPSASPLGFSPGSVIGWRGGGDRARGVVLGVRRRMRVYARVVGLLPHLVRAHFAFQLFGELPGHGTRAPHPVADLAGNLRQAFRPEYDERYGR